MPIQLQNKNKTPPNYDKQWIKPLKYPNNTRNAKKVQQKAGFMIVNTSSQAFVDNKMDI